MEVLLVLSEGTDSEEVCSLVMVGGFLGLMLGLYALIRFWLVGLRAGNPDDLFDGDGAADDGPMGNDEVRLPTWTDGAWLFCASSLSNVEHTASWR